MKQLKDEVGQKMEPHIDPVSGILTIYECNEICPHCHQFNFLSFGKCPVCGFLLTKAIWEYANGITTIMPEEWMRRVAETKARAADRMKDVALKLCVLCGATPTVCRGSFDYGRIRWWRIICPCGNHGPSAKHRTIAILEWNHAKRARTDRRTAAVLAQC